MRRCPPPPCISSTGCNANICKLGKYRRKCCHCAWDPRCRWRVVMLPVLGSPWRPCHPGCWSPRWAKLKCWPVKYMQHDLDMTDTNETELDSIYIVNRKLPVGMHGCYNIDLTSHQPNECWTKVESKLCACWASSLKIVIRDWSKPTMEIMHN